MNILMIAPQPVLEPRGTPISVYQRLRGLSSLGHTVDLLTYHLGENMSIPGVTIHRIPRVPFVKEIKVGPSWAKIPLDFLLLCKAIAMLFRKRYDVIHAHEEATFLSMFLAAVFRKRHIYDMHSRLPQQLANYGFGNYRPIVKLFETLERWAINTCDGIITVGSDLEAYVKETNPSARQVMIENLPVNRANGSSAHRSSIDELQVQLKLCDKVPVVYTGNFERYQGVDLLIDSAKIVREYHPEVVFVLVGGKSQQIEYWKEEVRNQHLEECVLFVGTVPMEEVDGYLELAEILISPRTEGLSVPLKIYSYLQSGKPIVATKIVAHTLVLDEDTAVLVEPTKKALAVGLMQLIESPELRRRLGLQARKTAQERYNLENYLIKLDRIYRMLELPTYAVEEPKRLLEPGKVSSPEL